MKKKPAAKPKGDEQEVKNESDTVTETISAAEVQTTAVEQQPAAKPKGDEELELGTVRSTIVSSSRSRAEDLVDKRLVKVKIKYPEGYKGPRHMKDEKEYSVAKETADLFIQRGIAEKV